MGIAPDRLRDAVKTLAVGKMRGERERNGITIINDCYKETPKPCAHAGTASGDARAAAHRRAG